MLSADVFVAKPHRLFVGQLHHLAGAVGKSFIHRYGPRPTNQRRRPEGKMTDRTHLQLTIRKKPPTARTVTPNTSVLATTAKKPSIVSFPTILPNTPCKGAGSSQFQSEKPLLAAYPEPSVCP